MVEQRNLYIPQLDPHNRRIMDATAGSYLLSRVREEQADLGHLDLTSSYPREHYYDVLAFVVPVPRVVTRP